MYFNKGKNDLKNKIIKTVDDPEKVFGSSESRLWRLLRFKNTNKGFTIDD